MERQDLGPPLTLENTGPRSTFLPLLLTVVYACSWLWSFLPAVGFALSKVGSSSGYV